MGARHPGHNALGEARLSLPPPKTVPQLLGLSRNCYIITLQLEFRVFQRFCSQIIQKSLMTIQRDFHHFQYILLTFAFKVKMTSIPHLSVVEIKILKMNLKWEDTKCIGKLAERNAMILRRG